MVRKWRFSSIFPRKRKSRKRKGRTRITEQIPENPGGKNRQEAAFRGRFFLGFPAERIRLTNRERISIMIMNCKFILELYPLPWKPSSSASTPKSRPLAGSEAKAGPGGSRASSGGERT